MCVCLCRRNLKTSFHLVYGQMRQLISLFTYSLKVKYESKQPLNSTHFPLPYKYQFHLSRKHLCGRFLEIIIVIGTIPKAQLLSNRPNYYHYHHQQRREILT